METVVINDYHARKTLIAEVQAAGRDILDKGHNPVFVRPKGHVDDYDIWCEIIQLSKMLVANGRNYVFTMSGDAEILNKLEQRRLKNLESARRYREKNHDKIIENRREYREKNRDKINEYARNYRKEKHMQIMDYQREYRNRMKEEAT